MPNSGAVGWRAGDLNSVYHRTAAYWSVSLNVTQTRVGYWLVIVSAVVHSHLLVERRQEEVAM